MPSCKAYGISEFQWMSCSLDFTDPLALTDCLQKFKWSGNVKRRTHQNHSLPKLGTEKTPQCMKMPNFAWSYHSGSGLESMDFQLGSYLALLAPICRINKSKGKTAKAPISVRHTDLTLLFRHHMTESKVAELTVAWDKKKNKEVKTKAGLPWRTRYVWFVSVYLPPSFNQSFLREHRPLELRSVIDLAHWRAHTCTCAVGFYWRKRVCFDFEG